MVSAVSRLVSLFCVVAVVLAKKKPKILQKVDLPGISCDVCEVAVQTLYTELKSLRASAPYNKLEEDTIQLAMENICKPDQESGEWIRYCDITTVQKNDGKDYAKLSVAGGVAKCEEECLTVARSCENLFEDEIDPDDLSAILYKNKHSLERLTVILIYMLHPYL
jgi:hypothetical protein